MYYSLDKMNLRWRMVSTAKESTPNANNLLTAPTFVKLIYSLGKAFDWRGHGGNMNRLRVSEEVFHIAFVLHHQWYNEELPNKEISIKFKIQYSSKEKKGV